MEASGSLWKLADRCRRPRTGCGRLRSGCRKLEGSAPPQDWVTTRDPSFTETSYRPVTKRSSGTAWGSSSLPIPRSVTQSRDRSVLGLSCLTQRGCSTWEATPTNGCSTATIPKPTPAEMASRTPASVATSHSDRVRIKSNEGPIWAAHARVSKKYGNEFRRAGETG